MFPFTTVYVNIRSKFIVISRGWCNVFQSDVIYHRRRQNITMTKLKGINKQCRRRFPFNMTFIFISSTESRKKLPHQFTHLVFLSAAAAIACLVQRTTDAGVTFKSRDFLIASFIP